MIQVLHRNVSEKQLLLRVCTTRFGLGKASSLQILDQLGISRCARVGRVSSHRLAELERLVDFNYLTGVPLADALRRSRDKLHATGSYRGSRHHKGLPCRGQRTHGNALTCRRLRDLRYSRPAKPLLKARKASGKLKAGSSKR